MDKSKNQVKAEKSAVLITAMGCITTGIQQISAGNVKVGVPLFACGITLVYAREHWKLGMWGAHTLEVLQEDLEGVE